VKIWSQTPARCPSKDEWMKKMGCMYVCTYSKNGIFFSHNEDDQTGELEAHLNTMCCIHALYHMHLYVNKNIKKY
jgi:hypothetical protein